MHRPVESPATATAVHTPHPHDSAHLHVSGEATYVDDIPELAGTLYAALGLSQHAHARITSIDFAAVHAAPGVVAVLTAKDIPGENNCGAIAHDDPIFAEGVVLYVGQPVFAVIAQSSDAARYAARQATISYEALPAVLTPQEAKRQQSFVAPPLHLQRGAPAQAMARAPRRLQGEFSVGGQEQFYLEGQISYAVPQEDNGIHLYCSTQSPTEMQRQVCHALNLRAHQVVCEVRRLGGGFGGKEVQSALFACVASVAAQRLQRPVKLRLDRDDDMMITGKRHSFHYAYEVGFDDAGRILGAQVEMVARAGFSADLSGPVITRALCHFDNAYYLSDVDITALAAKTNTQSNTAFRGFGAPQGAMAIEYMIDNIARAIGRDPLDVRQRNFYGKGERDVTPYGQTVEDNVLHELVAELEATSAYRGRREARRAFNATSPVLRKGIALTPVKFGISFNVVQANQAGALVYVSTDGSVLVSHGGTEMGQGLNTKVAQVVAHALGIRLRQVRTAATDTSKIPNTSATAASTGADLNGKAAQDAACQIRVRLAQFAAQTYGGSPEDVCFADDTVTINGTSVAFADLVQEAHNARVQLWSDGYYITPKIHWNQRTLHGRPSLYYAYGAAVSEVMVDTLTGEWKLVRADLLHDAGNSLNPAIDIGQVEGAFIQGMGWLTMEELWWNQEGRLMTSAPSTYKIPAVHDCPADFRVRLFKNANREDTILRSKAVGEPPLLLSFSVFFAIRDAVASVADYRVNPPLNAPATAEEILKAVESVKAHAAIHPHD